MPAGGIVRGKADQASQSAAIARVTEVAEHAAELRLHLEQILESTAFRGSRRSKDFLRYIVAHALDGQFDQLKERTIGIEVFQRMASYDTGEDSIVRVSANDVRKRLLQFYSESGADSQYRIDLPAGAYIPEFHRVLPPPVAFPAPPGESSAGALGPSSHPDHVRRPGWWPFWFTVLSCAVAACSVALTAWLFVRDQRLEHEMAAAVKTPAPRNPMWTELFNRDHETFVVCADSAWVLVQDLTDTPVTLSDYIDRNYSSKAPDASTGVAALLSILTQRQYTNISDVRLVQEILQLNHDYRDHTMVRSARNVQFIDFKKGNFVLLGSRRANPWVELFEPLLNFRFVYDPVKKRSGFHNEVPRQGENGFYWVDPDSPHQGQTYSLIAYVSNLSHNGSVLLIAGATGEGTEAAGEFITHPEFSQRMLTRIGALAGDHVLYFEVLLKSGTISGTPKNAEVIAYRLIKPTG